MDVQLLLLLIAVVLFVVDAFVHPPKVSLLSLGLACFAASFLVPLMK